MGRSADLCTCIYQKQRADRAEQEVERLRCIIELNFNLTQQAQNEVDRLETENEILKNLYAEAMVFQGRIISKNEKLKEDCEKFVYTLTNLVSHMDRFGRTGSGKRIYGSDDLTMLYEDAREVLFGN